jgi:hypothetical protein
VTPRVKIEVQKVCQKNEGNLTHFLVEVLMFWLFAFCHFINSQMDWNSFSQAGAEHNSALQRAILALVMPTYKRHFAPG